jgi:hypothetical protein
LGTEKQMVPAPTMSAHHSGVTSGWDPYEVWRTRVLRPRIAEEALGRLSLTAPVTALCVVAEATSGVDASSKGRESDLTSESIATDDQALRHELTNVIASLCLAGLTSIFLKDSERRPSRYASRAYPTTGPAVGIPRPR